MKSIVDVTGKHLWSGENPADKPSLAGLPVIDGVPPDVKFWKWNFALNAWEKDVPAETAYIEENLKYKAKGPKVKQQADSLKALIDSNPNWAIPANVEQGFRLVQEALANLSPGVPE